MVYGLNAMAGVIDGSAALLQFPLRSTSNSTASPRPCGLGIAVLGLWFFRRLEATFADVI
ncbi:MAG: hypothetical protein IPP94_13650 [Ignavibacteria bacterium]|nr:hypothetical protein [Ignavibacteria bacterium]